MLKGRKKGKWMEKEQASDGLKKAQASRWASKGSCKTITLDIRVDCSIC
jgi:hypothetical protein